MGSSYGCRCRGIGCRGTSWRLMGFVIGFKCGCGYWGDSFTECRRLFLRFGKDCVM